jgi:exodeoxyribonuclease VII large subunit
VHRLKSQLCRLHIDQRVSDEFQSLAWLRQRLVQSVTHRLQQAEQHHDLLKQKLGTLDPAAVLKRGYALMKHADRQLVRSAKELEPGQEAIVQLADGSVNVTVNHLETVCSLDGYFAEEGKPNSRNR